MEERKLHQDENLRNNTSPSQASENTDTRNETDSTSKQDEELPKDDPVIVSGTGNHLGNVLKIDKS